MWCKGGKLCVKLRNWPHGLPKKSIVKIIEKLGLEISAKSFAESIRKFSKKENRAKESIFQRIGFFIDRRNIERISGKKVEEIEIRTKIEIGITIVKEAVAWLLSLGFPKKRIHILSDPWYDSRV